MNILEKIKNFFSNLFTKKEVKSLDIPISNQEIIKSDARTNKFLESIKVKDNSYAILLSEKILKNEMKIEELSDTELNDLISFYKNKLAINN
ncbi:MAG: hypothetical protein ACI4UE_03000 [Candidatus Scatovivens sp.]